MLFTSISFLWLLQWLTHMAVLAILRHRQPRSVCITVTDSRASLGNAVRVECQRELQQSQKEGSKAEFSPDSAWTVGDDVVSAPTAGAVVCGDSVGVDVGSASASGGCRCPSCVLNFPNYIRARAWLRVRQRRRKTFADVTAEAQLTDIPPTHPPHPRPYRVGESSDGSSPALSAASVSDSILSTAPPSRQRYSLPWHPQLSRVVHPCLNYWAAHRWFFVLQILHWTWMVLVTEGVKYRLC